MTKGKPKYGKENYNLEMTRPYNSLICQAVLDLLIRAIFSTSGDVTDVTVCARFYVSWPKGFCWAKAQNRMFQQEGEVVLDTLLSAAALERETHVFVHRTTFTTWVSTTLLPL
jgi:hypothetical protein